MKKDLAHLSLALILVLAGSLCLSSCSREFVARIGATPEEDAEISGEWKPEEASMARHISGVHAFSISPEPDSCLQVTLQEDKILAKLRPDVLEKLGGEKALFILGWDDNPYLSNRSDYLFFLEGLHAMLVMSASEWRGDS